MRSHPRVEGGGTGHQSHIVHKHINSLARWGCLHVFRLWLKRRILIHKSRTQMSMQPRINSQKQKCMWVAANLLILTTVNTTHTFISLQCIRMSWLWMTRTLAQRANYGGLNFLYEVIKCQHEPKSLRTKTHLFLNKEFKFKSMLYAMLHQLFVLTQCQFNCDFIHEYTTNFKWMENT